MNTSLDTQLTAIDNLTWLPYIGSDYFAWSPEKRTLVVGESHYYNPTEENSLEKHLRSTFTREILLEMGIDREYWGVNLFRNFHLAMMGNDKFDSSKFWNDLSFYNFIQRPMKTNGERPNDEDFNQAWQVFHDLVRVIQPRKVIFIGTSAANHFNGWASRNKVEYEPVKWIEKISNAYAKRSSLTVDGDQIQIDFIRHTSQYFSWPKWHEYIKTNVWSPDKVD